MSDTLLRQWLLLREIPRAPKRADVRTLLAKLEAAGHRITKRTLQRDLVALSSVFPLQSDERAVPYGWFWSADTPAFDLPGMDGPTALTLRMIERYISMLLPPAVLSHLAPQFARARAVLRAGAGNSLGRWSDCVRVVPREMPLLPPSFNAQATQVVYDALLSGKRMTATYVSRSAADEGPRDYEINPLGLVVRGNLIYLVCTLGEYQDIRQLALHRISRAELLDKETTRVPDFDLDRYIEQGEFQYPVGPTIELEAVFERDAAAHLYETPLSQDQRIEDVDGDYLRVTATVRDTKQLEWWLLGFGDRAEVLAPVELRTRIAMSCRVVSQRAGVV